MKYIKTYKLYENSDLFDEKSQHLIDILHDKIIHDKKNINGFIPYVDNMTGAIEWSKDNLDCILYSTPYWDGEYNLPIDVNFNGEELTADYKQFNLKPLSNEKDIEIVLDFYYGKITETIIFINDRMEFIRIIPEILKFTKIEIDNVVGFPKNSKIISFDGNEILFNNMKSIYLRNMSSEDVSELLNMIKFKYPEINTIEEFNL
jgi:hypothetical protein